MRLTTQRHFICVETYFVHLHSSTPLPGKSDEWKHYDCWATPLCGSKPDLDMAPTYRTWHPHMYSNDFQTMRALSHW